MALAPSNTKKRVLFDPDNLASSKKHYPHPLYSNVFIRRLVWADPSSPSEPKSTADKTSGEMEQTVDRSGPSSSFCVAPVRVKRLSSPWPVHSPTLAGLRGQPGSYRLGFQLNVTGLCYYTEYPQCAGKNPLASSCTTVSLRRDIGNEHDPCAVEVLAKLAGDTSTLYKCGYIVREEAAALAPILSNAMVSVHSIRHRFLKADRYRVQRAQVNLWLECTDKQVFQPLLASCTQLA